MGLWTPFERIGILWDQNDEGLSSGKREALKLKPSRNRLRLLRKENLPSRATVFKARTDIRHDRGG